MKKRYRPKLDPKRDLAGATPETLVRALFRRAQPPAIPLENATTLPNTTPEDSHALDCNSTVPDQGVLPSGRPHRIDEAQCHLQ